MNHYVFYTSEVFSQTPLGEDIEKNGCPQNKIICLKLA